MGFDTYIDEGENYDDGRPRLVEECEDHKIAEPVDEFFELLEIEQKSVKEVAGIKKVSQESVEEAMKFYAEHYEEFNRKYGSELEHDIEDEEELAVPDESLDDLVDMMDGPYNVGCEILREAPEKAERSDLSIEEIESVNNGLAARMEEKNGVKGSIILNLFADNVRVSYGFSDGERPYNEQIFADSSEGVEAALDISFGRYAQLVKNN